MTTEIFSGKLRIQFQNNGIIDFRVIGENDVRGVEDALADVGRLEAYLRRYRIRHEAHKRKYGNGYRTDAVVVHLAQEHQGPERRQEERRRRAAPRAQPRSRQGKQHPGGILFSKLPPSVTPMFLRTLE